MKQSSKRLTSLLLSLLFFLVAFFGFFSFVKPAYVEISELRGKRDAEQNFLTTQTPVVEKAKQLLDSWNTTGGNASSVAMLLPVGERMADALTQLQGIAENSHLSLTSVAVSSPTVQSSASRTAATSSAANIRPVGNFSFKIAASGRYQDFRDFVTRVETNIRLFDVSNISIQPVSPSGATRAGAASLDYFNYNVTVGTYYQLP